MVGRYGRTTMWLLGATALLVCSVLAGAMFGSAGPTPWRVPLAIIEHLPLVDFDSGVSETQWNLIWTIRFPRVLLAALVGGMLSLGGASYQGVFRNPLVDPYLLGAAAGAGLGATIAILYLRDEVNWFVDPTPALAFVLSLATVAVTYTVGAAFGGNRTGATLVLAGVAMVSLTTAIQTFVLQRNSEVVREVYTWILGRLVNASWADIRLVLPYVAITTVILLAHARHLDLFRVGDDEAATLGAPVARIRLIVVVAATLGTAAVVSVSGLIGFVGLVVPHIVRLLAGASYRLLLPLSMLLGASFLILVDILSRIAIAPSELPVGVVTAFIGAPFFIYLLRTKRVAV